MKAEHNMISNQLSRVMTLTAALLLSACAAQHQAPAPVVAGGTAVGGAAYAPYAAAEYAPATNYAPAVTGANPYGAAPYVPAATAPAAAVYSPTAAPLPHVPGLSGVNSVGQTVGNVNGRYIGNYAPVNPNASTHRVSAGDTVYNIAKRYNITQDNLRAWNNLYDNTISIGQTLRVKAPGSKAAAVPSKPAPAVNPVYSPLPMTKKSSVPNIPSAQIVWTAPTAGTIVRSFGGDNKGVDISGMRGQPVVAAADGQVVYSGSNLRGYGNLIILQHNAVYLTAYGHNEALLVREGQFVRRGQQIARMGSSDSSSGVKLHFEVRENGNPVNPSRFVKF
ncbi:peptidoglycan DD-metalloendopeptidase family protein [Conchiformibius kuhniae]|uniref:Peptidoglycan DD-metalloendopeptidase family protein n=1 Tax=Conchiformibius kuhniae TaxID=211502 RepID=A0ABD8B7Y1_9NEIS|nr:peptidoglycan DD-metalloendopeptidase family protein [Conchiformibius kuhniae]